MPTDSLAQYHLDYPLATRSPASETLILKCRGALSLSRLKGTRGFYCFAFIPYFYYLISCAMQTVMYSWASEAEFQRADGESC